MPSTCRSPTDRAAPETRRREPRARALRARACRWEMSCRHRAALREAWRASYPSAASAALLLRPRGEPDLLVDEFQRVGFSEVEIRFDDAGAHHLVEEILHARVGHGADAERERIARIDDAVLLHLGDRIGDEVVGHLRVLALEDRVGRLVVAVDVVVPADDRGIDEALHQLRLLFHEIAEGVYTRAC